jgi:very-short-patch-repair endonuclease
LLPRNKSLKERSRNLRKNATKQENRLWYGFLRTQSPRWTRQRVIGSYIVDFYCHKRKLIIELDGSQHYQEKNMEYDNRRTLYLNSLGIEVMRFTNLDVDNNFEGVCAAVADPTNQTPADCVGTPFGKGAETPADCVGTPFGKGAETPARFAGTPFGKGGRAGFCDCACRLRAE